jgi:carboxymethylenebutenolidase
MNTFLRLGTLSSLVLLAVCAVAQDWAKTRVNSSPRHLEWVDLKSGTRTVKAFVAYPEVKEKVPVFVMIHEIFGMSDWAQLMADQLAAAGYIVVAPDFLSGMGPNGGGTASMDPTAVRGAMSQLTPEQVDGDLQAACDYAKKLPACNGKVVVGGFCWGGTQTFRFATKRSDLAGAFVFYGSAPTAAGTQTVDEAALKRITAPVHGFYAENDSRINATIAETERIMKANGKSYEPVTYAGGGHGFMRSGDQPDATDGNKSARSQAWARLMALLGKLK